MPHSFFNQNAEKSRLHCSAPGYLRPSVGGEPFTPDIVKTGLARKATGMPSLGEERINIYSIIVISADNGHRSAKVEPPYGVEQLRIAVCRTA
jgi:hypothetical protein